MPHGATGLFLQYRATGPKYRINLQPFSQIPESVLLIA